MSDFPKEGDIEATRAWLDKKGFHFHGLLDDWDAEALMRVESVDLLVGVLGKNNEGEGIRLWSLLNTAKKTPSPGEKYNFSNSIRVFPCF
jgi:hypothetical protein